MCPRRCEARWLELEEITPLSVGAYVEQLGSRARKPTVKVAIRKLFDYLTVSQHPRFQPSKFHQKVAERFKIPLPSKP